MPDVVTIGIGGGTIVRFKEDKCQLGPDSVGYLLKEKGVSFGGFTLTLSDFFLANDQLQIENILEKNNLKERIQVISGRNFQDALKLVKEQIQLSIEKLVDKLKTDPKEIPVIACGGGAFLLPKKIEGASRVLFPEHLEVANAFGACIAQISSEDEKIVNTLQNDEKKELEKLLSNAKIELLKKGASEGSINVLTKESIPLAYLPGAVKLKVKLCGDLIS
jgi:N-methylhydantoinase A/oxoprolinase/acetone carboxylase beta subunit